MPMEMILLQMEGDKKTSDTFNTNIVLLQGLDYVFFLFDHR